MESIEYLETEQSVKDYENFKKFGGEEPEPEYIQRPFWFRVNVVRDFYIDIDTGFIMIRLDNGYHALKYDEDLLNKLKYDINGT